MHAHTWKSAQFTSESDSPTYSRARRIDHSALFCRHFVWIFINAHHPRNIFEWEISDGHAGPKIQLREIFSNEYLGNGKKANYGIITTIIDDIRSTYHPCYYQCGQECTKTHCDDVGHVYDLQDNTTLAMYIYVSELCKGPITIMSPLFLSEEHLSLYNRHSSAYI